MEKDGKEGSRKKETAAESDGENEESRETVEIVKAWRQVSCDQHGETALTWAARHGDEVCRRSSVARGLRAIAPASIA